MKRRHGLLLFLLLASCAVTPPPAVVPQQPLHVVIVGTTDVHGWFAGHADKTTRTGGLAIFKSYVDALRAEDPGRVLLVDSGDLFQGTLESNVFEGEPVVRGYNALGYAAAAIGNHEFDFGPVGPAPVAQKPGDDPLGALKKNVADSKFAFLSANTTEKATGQTPSWVKRSVLVDAGGAKVGIIGLSTPETPKVTMAANVFSLDFGDPVAATLREAADLRKRGADAVIVIAHMGGKCGDMNDPADVASCEVDQEAMRFLEALPAGTIDAYFAGHTHQQMRQLVHGVPAMQALAYSNEFSSLDLWIDPAAHKVVKFEQRPHTSICEQVYSGTERCDARAATKEATLVPRVFHGRTIRADAQMAALFQPYLDKVAAIRNEPLHITTAAPIKRNRYRESPLGNLVSDALRIATGADVAVFNSGGIRADLRAGDLVYSDIFEVSPFDNYPAVVTMSGAQLRDMLRIMSSGDTGILQVSGLRYTVDGARPKGDRLTEVSIDPNATYRVAMPDFLAAGGEGLSALLASVPPANVRVDQSRPIRDLIIPALQKMPQPLDPKVEGRITVLNPSTPATSRE
ncbi:MAG TPA: 5'-nucleotidase C-terminal domain-containing protein [Thermoanaerobaculia bacterium]|jgi:5'-nucleotidase|nr:5'-nucleotidase C-terminal domain-containing protein [Thermoanaerobaculia bacterium]